MKSPILLVMAGPNGSGKSTITSKVKIIGDYINTDDIQKHLNCSRLDAAEIASATREYYISHGLDFTFETLLSSSRGYFTMKKAKEKGFKVICVYMLTKDPKINISRVEARASKGGHYILPDDVIKYYKNAISLFPNLFEVCDECYVYDNSLDRSKGTPSMIIKFQNGSIELFPNEVWSLEMIETLCNGNYYK